MLPNDFHPKPKNVMRTIKGNDEVDGKGDEDNESYSSGSSRIQLDNLQSTTRKRSKPAQCSSSSTSSLSISHAPKKKLSNYKKCLRILPSSSSSMSSFSDSDGSERSFTSGSASLSSGPRDPLDLSGNTQMESHPTVPRNQSPMNESRVDEDVIAVTSPIPDSFDAFEAADTVLVNNFIATIESIPSEALISMTETLVDQITNLDSGPQDAAHSSTPIDTPSTRIDTLSIRIDTPSTRIDTPSTAPASPQSNREVSTQISSTGPFTILLTNPKITFCDEDRKRNKYLDLLFRTRPELDKINSSEMKPGEVLGHRIVLEQIPFVERQLTSEFFDIINVPDLKGSAVEAVVRSFYTNQLELTEDTVESILEVLDKFELLNRIDCWTLRSSALFHRNDKVVEAVDNYIVKNFATRSCDFNFLTLPFILLDYYVAKGVNDRISNTVLLNGILKWASQNSEDRKQHLCNLIRLLDLGEIFNEAPDVLKLAFAPGSLLDSIPACAQLHNKVLANKAYELRNGVTLPVKEEWNIKVEGVTVKSEPLWSKLPNIGSSSSVFNPITSSSKSTQGISGFSSISTKFIKLETESKIFEPMNVHIPLINPLLLFPVVEYGTRYLEAFDFTENKAYRLHRMKRPREFSSLVQLRNRIYEIGGSEDGRNATIWDDITSTSLVDIFKKGVNLSTSGPHLMRKRRVFTAVVVNDVIYAVGGDSKERNRGQCVSNVVETLDTRAKLPKWKITSHLNGSRSCQASVTMDNKIYIVGGVGEIQSETGIDQPDLAAITSVEVYSLRHETWTKVCSMKTGRRCLRLHVMDNKIYAIGGEDPNASLLSTVEVYNPDDDTWADVAPMNHGRSSFGVLEINGLIYVIGGNSKHSLELNIEVYNPLEDKWTVLPWPVKLNRHARLISSTTLSRDYVKS